MVYKAITLAKRNQQQTWNPSECSFIFYQLSYWSQSQIIVAGICDVVSHPFPQQNNNSSSNNNKSDVSEINKIGCRRQFRQHLKTISMFFSQLFPTFSWSRVIWFLLFQCRFTFTISWDSAVHFTPDDARQQQQQKQHQQQQHNQQQQKQHQQQQQQHQ